MKLKIELVKSSIYSSYAVYINDYRVLGINPIHGITVDSKIIDIEELPKYIEVESEEEK